VHGKKVRNLFPLAESPSFFKRALLGVLGIISEPTHLSGTTRMKQIVSKFEYASSTVLPSAAPRHAKNRRGEGVISRRDPQRVSNTEPGQWKNETPNLTVS